MVQSPSHGFPLSNRPTLTSSASSTSLGTLSSLSTSSSLPSIRTIRTPPSTASSVAASTIAYQSPTALTLGSLKARKKMIQNTVQKPSSSRRRQHRAVPASTTNLPLECLEDDRQVDGIVYQSRVKVPQAWNFTNAKERWQAAVARTTDEQHPHRHRQSLTGEFMQFTHPRPSDYMPQNAEARSRCAESLYKLSKQVGSEAMIIDSGAIQNIADFCDTEDSRLQAYCAATLANLTATTALPVLVAFAAHDGIPVVLEVSWSLSFHVKVLCTTTLCRLSCYPEFTKTLFASKAVIELSNMLSLPHPPLQKLCIQTLVNMICHGCEFHEKLFCGGGNVGHNKLGLVLAIAQLVEEPTNGRFAAEVIFNLSLFPTSAAGAIRGGIGEVLYHLIQAPHTTLTYVGLRFLQTGQCCCCVHRLTKLRFAPSTTYNDSLDDSEAIAQLIATASGHFSKYLDLQLIMGSWSLKIVQHFLFLYESSLPSQRLAFVLGHCARILANLSANDEYIHTIFNGNKQLVERTVRLHAWVTTTASNAPPGVNPGVEECQQNVLRTLANLTRCPLCCPLLVQSGVFDVLNEVLLMESTSKHVASMKNDALVALVNLVCHDAIAPASGLDSHLADCLSASFRLNTHDDSDKIGAAGHVKYMLSLTICYLALNPTLRRVVTADPAVLIDALLYGFHYAPPPVVDAAPTSFGNGMLKLQQQLREQPLDTFDDVEGDPTDTRFRFLAAMCHTAGEFKSIAHVQSLVDVVVACVNHTNVPATKIPLDQAFGAGAVEYFCAGILFTLSRTIWTVLQHPHTADADWSDILFAPRVQDVMYQLSRFATSSIPPVDSRGMNLRSAIQAYCTGTLYHMCATGHTTATALLALVEACNGSEDPPTLLACASTFAIVSFTSDGRQLLLTTPRLAHALNKLGRSSMCQQYAAVAACNVAITGCMWNEEELKDFVVVALLRSNSFDAIQIHAKTLYNLLSHPASRAQVIDDGVLYAFLKLAQLQTNGLSGGPEETLSLCLHALFNLSDSVGYHDTILKLGVTAFLLGGVSGRRKRVLNFLTLDSRRHAVGLLCNLSAREANHKELIHNAQVTDILRCLCDGDTETRASAAMTLRNLTLRVGNAEVVCTRHALNLLLTFLTSSNDSVRRLAAQAVGNCSLVTELLHLFVEMQVGDALLQVLETRDQEMVNNLSVDTARAIMKTLHNLALDDSCAADLLHVEMIRRWQDTLPPLLHDPEVCSLAATTIHIMSRKKLAAPLLASQNIVAICRLLNTTPTSVTVLAECMSCLVHLSTHVTTHAVLFDTGVVSTLGHLLDQVKELAPPLPSTSTAILFTHAAMAIRNLSLSAAERPTSHQDQRIPRTSETPGKTATENSAACDQLMRGVPWLVKMVRGVDTAQPCYPKLCVEVCVAMANLCKIKRLRATFVSAGIVHMLLDIHRTFKSNPACAFLEQSSTVTLHQLAAEDTAKLEPGLIEALLSVLNHTDVVVHQVQHEEGRVSRFEDVTMRIHHDAMDQPLPTSESLCRQTYRDARWFHYIVEAPSQLDPSFDGAPMPLNKHRLRGPLPAVQDATPSMSSLRSPHIIPSTSSALPHTLGRVLAIDTNKAHLEDDLALDELAARASSAGATTNQLRFTPVKKFDHHMKMTRKQSRRGYVGTSTSALPQIKSELQVEK
ncbi:hypothetical protein H310_03890 [Aphanomyces invadans]|uniref:Vacuolar protein 8 n=1 Tax=Aphanomyces invadans TaxID=157072 RepID=A0A024UFS7_9STRA|nr:hypothetical protein H310_03890 [Aphanomyces invadans]ETW04742.1 hypothetical protein H310_03890 [Aphanomyces invadans]|eukprot:XP_008866180.1 hypothetical protein H310_03890 [Aphanomyces invadans]